jgi:hypothetical protein
MKARFTFQGFRGRPAADLEALEDTLVRVSHLAMHMEGHLAELDINPLRVLSSGIRSGREGGRRPRASRCVEPHVGQRPFLNRRGMSASDPCRLRGRDGAIPKAASC